MLFSVPRWIVEKGKSQALESDRFVLEQLRDLDPVAYVRFASVYREFQDVQEFVAELESLATSPKKTVQNVKS